MSSMVGGIKFPARNASHSDAGGEDDEYDKILFEKLKNLRTKEAQRLQVPPYVVFGDKALIQMAKHMPKNPEEFLQIHGVANKKLDQFGEQFMQVIQDYINENM